MTSTFNRNSSNGAGFFLILTLIFLSISVWQTAQGYELLLGNSLSWVFSFAIGLMMLYLALEMRKRRLSAIATIGPLIGYIACAIYCFFGNFNAIYTRFNKEELYKNELIKHKQELTATVTYSISALERADTASTTLEKEVKAHKNNLLAQILNVGNLGVGSKAMTEINVIGNLLGQPLTILDGSPEQLAKSYSDNIDNILSTKLKNSKQSQANVLIEKIKHTEDTLNPIIYEALKPQNIASQGQNVIFVTVDAINDIGEETKNFLGDSFNYKFEPVSFENQELGKISQTFRSAFNGYNGFAAFISIALAIAIDALVPFVVLVGTRRIETNDDDDQYRDKTGVVILR